MVSSSGALGLRPTYTLSDRHDPSGNSVILENLDSVRTELYAINR